MNNFETNMSSAQEIQPLTIESELPEKLRALRKKIGGAAMNSTGFISLAFATHNIADSMFPTASPAASIGGSLIATTAFFVGGNKINSMLNERKARKRERTTSETQPISTEIDDTDTPVV